MEMLLCIGRLLKGFFRKPAGLYTTCSSETGMCRDDFGPGRRCVAGPRRGVCGTTALLPARCPDKPPPTRKGEPSFGQP